MTRELKFRVWSQYYKRYRFFPEEFLGVKSPEDGKVILASVYVDDVIEQYTGLKDKNGKEIYEGDIFRNAINGGTWRVCWNEKDAAFWVDSGYAGCSLGEFDWDRNNKKIGFIRKNCDVIGNIHENGELLKGDKK